MDKRNVAVGWIVSGSILIASAFFNLVVNLNSVPSVWSGPIYVILALGFLGVAFVIYGTTVYRRVSRTRAM